MSKLKIIKVLGVDCAHSLRESADIMCVLAGELTGTKGNCMLCPYEGFGKDGHMDCRLACGGSGFVELKYVPIAQMRGAKFHESS